MTIEMNNNLTNDQLPFTQELLLRIKNMDTQAIQIQAVKPTGVITPPTVLASKLFYRHEPSFYGLRAKIRDAFIEVSYAQMIELLSPRYRHPFITLSGIDTHSTELIHQFEAIAQDWNTGSFWTNAKWDENSNALQFDKQYGSILQHAVAQKLYERAIEPSQIPQLIPYFNNGGWPITSIDTLDDIQLVFRLREPEEDEENWLFESVIVNKKTSSIWTPAVKKRAMPIEYALPEKWTNYAIDLESAQQKMLTLLGQQDGSLFEHASAASFIYLQLNDAEVRQFLQQHLPLLQSLDFEVMLPTWLKELKQSKMKVRVSANSSNSKSVAGLDDILMFKWQFSMNNEQIDEEQFRKLVDEKREFIKVGNEWFRIDANWLEEMKKLMEQAEEENWTVRELVFKELPETLLEPLEDEDDAERDDPLFAFEMQKSLKQFVNQLAEKQGLPSVAISDTLQAQLRPYQQEGYEWLVFMREQGFGACLADDMGLGKTVQLITYILYTIEQLQNEQPSLIICPTSVLGNWQKELQKFAPSIQIHTHYGSNRLKDEAFHELLNGPVKPQIILTTFGTVTQDISFLENVKWNVVGLDEAQNIKNMQTQQSRSIRKLKGAHHIALTGTPVENRLSELWAIFDFIHKGYLGSFGKFQEQFITPIERDESEKHKHALRMKIRPFLLRRTKRDPALQLNLPEKQESQEFCPLTTEQAALYEGYIADTMSRLEEMSAFEKRGHILKMLNKLKQLCNHPALYLKEPLTDSNELLKRSIKLQRLVSMSMEIVDNGEQCLIFTQYIGMGNLLQHVFSELYDLDVPFLTGSMPKQQRDRLVDSFQNGEFPIFILSLKAGGTGLNLTAANHVLHADRWWNPAVENQATDRAYRIGQKQFVQVHKFVTLGTIEEKIDKMLEIKSALSEELIQSSHWITELNDAELQELLTLDI